MISPNERLERSLASVLHDDAPGRAPDELRRRVLSLTAARPQRGRWLPSPWLPRRARSAFLAAAGLLLVALLATAGVALLLALAHETRPDPSPAPVPSATPLGPIVAGPWRSGSAPTGVVQSTVLGWHDERASVLATLGDAPRQPGRLFTYEPGIDRWTDGGDVDYRVNQVASSAAIVAGRAYLFGQSTDAQPGANVVWTLDLATRAATFEADVVNTWTNSVAASRPDGMIYVLDQGGWWASGGIAPGLLRLYDPVAGDWQDLPPQPTPRAEGRLAVDALGRAYVLGGWTDGACFEPEPSVTECPNEAVTAIDRFDPTAASWEVIGQLPSPRSDREFETFGMTPVVAADGALYIARLTDAVIGPGLPYEVWRVRVERLDLNAREWSAFGELPNSGAMSLLASDDGWLMALGEGQWAVNGALNVPVWTTRLPGY